MLRPPMLCGRPALGWTEMGRGVSVFNVSSASSIDFGPTEQLSPIVSTPESPTALTKLSSVAPLRRLPSSLIVTCAMIGVSGLTSLTARIACSNSGTRTNVSSMIMSAPPSRRPFTCSRNASRASSKETFPSGSISTPSGPTDPATRVSSPATAFASWAPRLAIS